MVCGYDLSDFRAKNLTYLTITVQNSVHNIKTILNREDLLLIECNTQRAFLYEMYINKTALYRWNYSSTAETKDIDTITLKNSGNTSRYAPRSLHVDMASMSVDRAGKGESMIRDNEGKAILWQWNCNWGRAIAQKNVISYKYNMCMTSCQHLPVIENSSSVGTSEKWGCRLNCSKTSI